MNRRYVVTDVFTSRPFGGNPLAVVLDAEGLSDQAMQSIAMEFNFSETTFVLPPEDPAHTARVRIFTPTREIPFAGHPNVGTAHVLAQDLAVRNQPVPESFLFEEGAGLVPVRILPGGAELTAPQPLSRHATLPAERLAPCLRLPREAICTTTHLPQVVSAGLRFLAVELASRAILRDLAPDAAALTALLPFDGALGVYLYTTDVGEDGAALELDLQARMFFPARSLVEDPATGSATVAVAAFLAHLAGTPRSYRIGQGFDMGRPSLLLARITPTTSHVGGQCVTIMEGTIRADLASAAPCR